jgi:superfamily I DNA/RNA helicase
LGDGAEVAISVDLLASLAALTSPLVKRVHQTIKKLEQDPDHSGLDYKRPQGARDTRIRTCRVNDNYRMVCAEAGRNGAGRRTIIALTVRAHDEAYHWAERQVLTIDGVAGAHVVDVVAVEAVPVLTPAGLGEAAVAGPLSAVDDRALQRFGVPQDLLPVLRSAFTEIELEARLTLMPPQVADAVRGLAAGLSQDDVWAEVAGAYSSELAFPQARTAGPGARDDQDLLDLGGEVGGPDDLAVAVTSGASADRFHVFADDAALERALLEPLARWRIFLHPRQSAAVTRTYSGPARVTGGPGTGKTVVAIHRAAHLARTGQGQVLLTTFTKNLAYQLQAGLRSLLAAEELDRVTVLNVDALVIALYARRVGTPPDLTGSKTDKVWSRVHAAEGGDRPLAFYQVEWRDVVEQRGVADLAQYLTVERRRPGTPLTPPQRQAVWRVLERFATGLDEQGLATFGQLADRVAAALTAAVAAGEPHPYRHVVVDEAQDLSSPQWRMLRALVASESDDLFLAGDGRQRIYSQGASLRSLGIETRGRSQRLRLSYRSTAEILRWAEGILAGTGVPELGDAGNREELPGVTSLMSGPAPTTAGHLSPEDERRALVGLVSEWLSTDPAGLLPHEIAIAVRTNKVRDEITEELRAAGIPAHAMITDDEREDAVTVATMHRLKGTEYRAVIVADVKDGTVPNRWAIKSSADDDISRAEALLQERCLLYVACTRARERLHVSWSGTPSPFLAGHQEGA